MSRTARKADHTDTADTASISTQETSTMTAHAEPQSLTYATFSTPVDALSPAAVAYLLQYGFAKSLQDAASGIVKAMTAVVAEGGEKLAALQAEFPDVAEADLPRAAADAKMRTRFESILSGTVGTRTASGPRPSTFESEMAKVSKEFLRNYAKAKGVTLPKAESDDYKALLARYISRNEQAIREETERRLGAASAVALDADDIFG